MVNVYKESLRLHKKFGGKIEITPKVKLKTPYDLSLAYTPGVAEVSREIAKNPKKALDYTCKKNMVAVVSDGSAVLGLGNQGALAAIPVMEGKCAIFKQFAGVDAFPICLDTQDPKEIIKTVKNIAPSFSGINLEDISAPNCFQVEKTLAKILNIPVFHDDQHGTSIVVLAGLINALKVVKKEIKDVKIVINGAGSAGVAITKLLLAYGAKKIILLDSKGIISRKRDYLYPHKKEMIKFLLKEPSEGRLEEALVSADVFIGVSQGNILKKNYVKLMKKDPIVFALANPTPEIDPSSAKEALVKVMATGRSDFPNQLNNALVFPGFFKGLLAGRISKVTEKMKLDVAKALSSLVEKPTSEKIIPSIFDKRVVETVANAVMRSR